MDPYVKIMSVLTEPLTAKEIGAKIRPFRNGYALWIRNLYDAGVLTRSRHPYFSRMFVYKKVRETITEEEVKALLKAKHKPPPPVPTAGARIITFNTEEMRKKLRENDKINRRKSGKIYVSANWKFD